MDEAEPDLIPLQRNLILFFLLWLTATSWAVLVWQSDANMGMTMVSPIMGLRALLFLAIWVIMMVAMMLPTAAPMILTFHNVHARNRSLDDAFASTWVFVGAYLLVWAFAGIAAFAGVLVAEIAAERAALPPATAAQADGVIFLVAGIYEVTLL